MCKNRTLPQQSSLQKEIQLYVNAAKDATDEPRLAEYRKRSNIVFFGILLSGFGFFAYASSAEEQQKPAPSAEQRFKDLMRVLPELKGKEEFNRFKITRMETFKAASFKITLSNGPVTPLINTAKTLHCRIEQTNPLFSHVPDRYDKNHQHFAEMDDIFKKLPGEEGRDGGPCTKEGTIDWGNKASETKDNKS